MSAITHREHRPLMDLLDWVDSPMAVFRPFGMQPMRVETFIKNGKYTVRTELPGVDPERDIDVSVADGVLTIHAERREEKVDKTHSEFRYGEFSRQLVLPEGTDQSNVNATYDKGILEVVAAMKREGTGGAERKIPVKAGAGRKTGK